MSKYDQCYFCEYPPAMKIMHGESRDWMPMEVDPNFAENCGALVAPHLKIWFDTTRRTFCPLCDHCASYGRTPYIFQQLKEHGIPQQEDERHDYC